MENLEKRYVVELRANAEDRTISGTAIVFNCESVLMGEAFSEIIKPESVTPELIANSNIVMLWNHENGQVPLARSKNGIGTLKITITDTGVDFEFKARNTPQGDEILAAVRAGDVDACSFAFAIAESGDNWMKKPDGTYLRTITAFSAIADFSLVNTPAYTQASCRSLEAFKATEVSEVIIPVVEIPASENVIVETREAEVIVLVEKVYTDSEELVAYYQTLDAVIENFKK